MFQREAYRGAVDVQLDQQVLLDFAAGVYGVAVPYGQSIGFVVIVNLQLGFHGAVSRRVVSQMRIAKSSRKAVCKLPLGSWTTLTHQFKDGKYALYLIRPSCCIPDST